MTPNFVSFFIIIIGVMGMLYIGEKIFYPSFGAGVILNIEEKELYGDINKYYVIKLSNGLTTMVPVKSIKAKRIRKCIDRLECINMIKSFKSLSVDMPKKWLDKTKFYTRIMKEGDIKKMCALFNILSDIKVEKGISNTEEKLLEDILQMICEEISSVLDIDIVKVKIAIEKGNQDKI